MRMFPGLFKLDSKGKVRRWYITANDPPGTYRVSHGTHNGKSQETVVHVTQKNIGKANETSLIEQAELEAESKWKKQQDKGYVVNAPIQDLKKNMSSAKSLLPMLAKSFKDDGKKIVFPCYYQPKLDGIRCISYKDGNDIVMLSRKGKQFGMISHLAEHIKDIICDGWVLDGELFSPTLDFQTITSIVRQSKTEHDRVKEIQYHIYDCFKPGDSSTFEQRFLELTRMFNHGRMMSPLQLVFTSEIRDESEVAEKLEENEALGYEGIMLRNKDGVYENDRRSPHLQKVKSFIDEEFEIVGGKQGKGKFEGMCIFQCITEEGKEFDVMPKGSEAQRKNYWNNLASYIGKHLTVKYFERTTEENVPRFPVGLAVREDYE